MNRIKPYEFDKFVPLKHDEEATDLQNDYLQNIFTDVHSECVFLFSKSMTGRISFEYLSQEWWLELKHNKENLESFLVNNNRYFTAEHRSKLYVYSHSVHNYFEYIPNLYNKAVWGYVKHNVMIISYNQFLVNLFDFLNCLCVRNDLTVEIVDDKFEQLDEQISILNNNLKKMKDIISKIS
ncbi:Ras-related small GTPase, Rho type [Trachipleistophora hominis]|uniref:Ras-related small GTPase, Rho type n=1 Tax=Trachipleistophora hominis TaxID=72359 RepID=L7JWN2_TRAHO|nr:Ras-related small GTPase, Rho type [Trachipleistophora hominis]